MRYFISAGEASGDLHAAQLAERLKELDPEATFAMLGGDMLAQATGTQPVIHYRQMAFMGFSEVLRNLRTIFANLRRAKQAITDFRPDVIILVDYPGFNFKLARFARKLGIPVHYYISPKVWAWKQWRIKQMRRDITRLYSILPFEVPFFADKRMPDVVYVGNPSREEVDRQLSHIPSAQAFRQANGLDPQRPILALVPGSRRGEIRNNLPIMDAVARRHPDMQAVIAAAPGIDTSFYAQYSSLPLIAGSTLTIMHHATAALVTSGTATLECALAGTPQVVCYRANGSRLSYNIMRLILKGRFVALPNLIVDDAIIPEMLVHLCTVDSVDRELSDILPGAPGRQKQLDGYARLRQILGNGEAAATTASLIYSRPS